MKAVVLPLALALTLSGTVALHAQQAAPAPTTPAATAPAPAAAPLPLPTPPPPGPDAYGRYTLHEGDDVNLQFAQDLSSKTSSEGDPIVFTLADDIKVGNVVLVKAGAKAFGEVTQSEKAGMMGKAGQLNMRLDYLKAGDVKVKLRGTKGKEGENKTTSTVVLTVLFGPIGLIKHGKNVEIKTGQALHVFVAEDIPLVPAS